MDGLSSPISSIPLFGFLLLFAAIYGHPIQPASSQSLDPQNYLFPNVCMVRNGQLVSPIRPNPLFFLSCLHIF
ncbi:hypothetical protein GYMLUDRAFT_935050 [Collybiopsis luxurians FD-317 M1]|nr:hypothetical protein GYMLUDRAFT_935050 [Collybiopsis luxurians FD-317 M1]